MHHSVKRLGIGDLAALRQMLALFARVFHEREPNEADLPPADYLQRLLAKDDLHLLVALDGEQVVGGISGYELELCSRPAKEIYIYDLAVDPHYRRQGIARSLVRALQEIAQRQNASLLFVEAHAEDTEAVAFYQSLNAEMEDVKHFNIQ